MLQSGRQIPCFCLQTKADLTELMAFRPRLTKSLGVKVTTNDFFIRAIALAVKEYPLMAGRLNDDSIQIADSVNVGFAVSAPQGLVVPVIKNAHEKPLARIAAEAAELLRKARSDSLTPSELADACITLSNLGVYSIDSFTAIVTPGQCSILAVGNIIDTCVPQDDGIVVRKMMALDLAADHRIVNGAYAARFLNSIVQQLQNPGELAE